MRRYFAVTAALLAAVPFTLAAQGGADRCGDSPRSAVPFARHLADSSLLFRGQFSPDGNELWYFKKVTPGQHEDYRIFVSRRRGNEWGPGERVLINGEFSELYPAISPDGRRLVYSSYEPVPGDTSHYKNAHIYLAERRGDRWGPGVLQRSASVIGHYNSGPRFGANGELLFDVTTPDWRTRTSMISQWNGQEYGVARPHEIPEVNRWKDWRSDMHLWGGRLAPGDSIAVLDISPIAAGGRRGPAVIYLSVRNGGQWSEPRPAGGGVNAAGHNNFVFFSSDGCELLFTRGFSTFYHVSLAAALAGN
jgi:WD40-like Beta Propeller Repeat